MDQESIKLAFYDTLKHVSIRRLMEINNILIIRPNNHNIFIGFLEDLFMNKKINKFLWEAVPVKYLKTYFKQYVDSQIFTWKNIKI